MVVYRGISSGKVRKKEDASLRHFPVSGYQDPLSDRLEPAYGMSDNRAHSREYSGEW